VPSLADQFAAVFSAFVPFCVALFFLGLACWRICEWRYRAVIEKMEEMATLSRTEVEHWKDAAARNSSKVTQAAELLQKKELPAEVKPVLEQLTQASTRVTFLLLGTQFGGYDESIPDYRDGRCFSLVRQRRGVGSNLLSKVQ
jgi:hypothetical protein